LGVLSFSGFFFGVNFDSILGLDSLDEPGVRPAEVLFALLSEGVRIGCVIHAFAGCLAALDFGELERFRVGRHCSSF
jgi:hypothetical protein